MRYSLGGVILKIAEQIMSAIMQVVMLVSGGGQSALTTDAIQPYYLPSQQNAYVFGDDSFDVEYQLGYVNITNSTKGPSQLIWAKEDVAWYLPKTNYLFQNRSKDWGVYIDHYNQAKYKDEYLDVREYVWVNKDTGIVHGQTGAVAAQSGATDNWVMREFHFYKSGTLNQSNPIEVDFKGIMQLTDLDLGEGYTINNVYKAFLWRDTSVVYSGNNTWKGTYEGNDLERQSLWVEVSQTPQNPLRLQYWAYMQHSGHINYGGTVVTGTLTYKPNGAPGNDIQQVISLGYDTVIANNSYQWTDHEFLGWNTSANGSGTWVYPGNKKVFNSQQTLYAQWRSLYQITYYPNGGNGNPYKQNKFNSGDWLQVSQNLFWRDGYKFIGWNTNPGGGGTQYSEYQQAQFWGNTNLYAQWEQLYRITYDPNGARGFAYKSGYFEKGQNVTVDQNSFQRPGYRFMGWNTDRNGQGTSYTPGKSYVFWGNITLYAQWEPLYKLTVDPNDGTYTDSSTGQSYSQPSTWELIENETKRINDSFRPGYNFRGYQFN